MPWFIALLNQNSTDALALLINAGLLANESFLEKTSEGWQGQGDMVDVAFLVLAAKFDIDYQDTRSRCKELAQIPYESENAFCASINHFQDKTILFVKGSVETLAIMCALNNEVKLNELEQQVDQLASGGYRVLGVAYKELESIPKNIENELAGLSFVGMVGMIDPLRNDVISAVDVVVLVVNCCCSCL